MKLNTRKHGGWLVGWLLLGTVLAACGETSSSTNPAQVTTAPPTAQAKPDPTQIETQLSQSWESYKSHFIQNDGRVVDPTQAAISTSEGESYALLRSVWVNDRATFDRVLRWSKDNLQTRPDDKLYAYRWGQAQGDQGWQTLDKAAASDADTDIALSLLFAAKRWNDDSYKQTALEVLKSVWEKEVVTVNGKPYLTAGDWAVAQARPALNPSYLSPYAYRIFAEADKSRPWLSLVDTSYAVINGCSQATLDGKTGKNLPPNWCGIDKATGQFTTAQDYPKLDTNYGYDAFRTMWRLALDYKWFGEKRALDYLKAASLPRQEFGQSGKLAAEHALSGEITKSEEDLANYGGTLGNFLVTDPALADRLVTTKLLPAYQNVQDNDPARAFAGWGDSHNYYNQNWVWFGLALYADRLPNLAANPATTKN